METIIKFIKTPWQIKKEMIAKMEKKLEVVRVHHYIAVIQPDFVWICRYKKQLTLSVFIYKTKIVSEMYRSAIKVKTFVKKWQEPIPLSLYNSCLIISDLEENLKYNKNKPKFKQLQMFVFD